MNVVSRHDQFGRLIFEVRHGKFNVEVTSARPEDALADLEAALADTERDGCGECFWVEGGGDYRWMFRRTDDLARVAILWCSNPVTGWEHVFDCEAPWKDIRENLRAPVAAV